MIHASDFLESVACLWSEMIRRLYVWGTLAEIAFLLNAQWVAKLSLLPILSHPSYFSLGWVSPGRHMRSVSPVYQARHMTWAWAAWRVALYNAQAPRWLGPHSDGLMVALAQLLLRSASHIHPSCLGWVGLAGQEHVALWLLWVDWMISLPPTVSKILGLNFGWNGFGDLSVLLPVLEFS